MKKFCIYILTFILLFLTGCDMKTTVQNTETAKVCATWLYFSELSMTEENGGTEESFRNKTEAIFDECDKLGINNVFYQVRPFCDAFYQSEIFPMSAYLTGKQGKTVNYDPLRIAVEIAHKRNIRLHAWINPFRISSHTDISKLAMNNPALKYIKAETPDVVKVENGYYFSPASENAQKLIVAGVREIVNNYGVDGIHIDDYFYPSINESVDSYYYDKYKNDGGKLSLKEWRLNTVSSLVLQLYNTTKSADKSLVFSISPAGNIKNNYDQQYADVKLWMKEKGYADWIIPQIYYGYQNEFLPFDNALEAWSNMEKCDDVKLIYGIGAYRVNNSDEEWESGSGIIRREIEQCKESSNYYGCAFFSYSSMIGKSSDEFVELGNIVLS